MKGEGRKGNGFGVIQLSVSSALSVPVVDRETDLYCPRSRYADIGEL